MPPPAPLDAAAYLVIVDWGNVIDRHDRVRVLAEAAGLDPQVTMLRAPRTCPLVIARIDADTAPSVVAALAEQGVSAHAPSGADLRALADPLTIKTMHREHDAWTMTFREATFTAALRPEAIRLIVRAEVGPGRSASKRAAAPTTRLSVDTPDAFSIAAEVATDLLILNTTGAIPGTLDPDPATTAPPPKPAPNARPMIDLWTNDAQRFRIDADRFAWHVLGPARAHSDRANADLMLDLFSEAAPHAITDGNFVRFSIADPAAEKLFSRPTPGTKIDPAFEFYSRWAWTFYAGR